MWMEEIQLHPVMESEKIYNLACLGNELAENKNIREQEIFIRLLED